MGLLDQIVGNMGGGAQQKKPGLGSTVAAGVVLALLVKGVRQYQQSHGQAPAEGRSFDPQAQAQVPAAAAGGGLGGMLGGLLGGASAGGAGGGLSGGLGGLLGGLGGAGALGALIGQLQQKGLGQQAGSWVGTGQNQPVAPAQLADALGEDNLRELEGHTGMPRAQLLDQLAHELPEAVNQLTPNGALPDDHELHRIADQGG